MRPSPEQSHATFSVSCRVSAPRVAEYSTKHSTYDCSWNTVGCPQTGKYCIGTRGNPVTAIGESCGGLANCRGVAQPAQQRYPGTVVSFTLVIYSGLTSRIFAVPRRVALRLCLCCIGLHTPSRPPDSHGHSPRSPCRLPTYTSGRVLLLCFCCSRAVLSHTLQRDCLRCLQQPDCLCPASALYRFRHPERSGEDPRESGLLGVAGRRVWACGPWTRGSGYITQPSAGKTFPMRRSRTRRYFSTSCLSWPPWPPARI